MLSNKLSKPSLFLASPFDVQYLRDLTMRLHAEKAEGKDEALGLFAWEKDTADDPFDDRFSAQEQIPSPRDRLCRGVVAIFGEWIGRDLPRDHDKTALSELNAEDDGHPYRLVHPWRDGAEETGGFPLTGSTYEVLSTLAARRAPGAPDLLLLFVGSEGMDQDRDVSEEDWGRQRLRQRLTQQCLAEKRPRKELNARLDKLDLQIRMLRNFFRYLNAELGFVPKIVADEGAAGFEIGRFLQAVMGPGRAIGPDEAFKGLGFFDEGDRAVYFGRETAVRAALDRIEALWREDEPHLYWVRGQSGSGKSSFLRAGLVGSLRQRIGSACVRLIVTPNRLVNTGIALKPQEAHWPLRRLVGLTLAELRGTDAGAPEIAGQLAAFDAAGETALDWAVARVAAELGAGGGGRRLVLAFDQFEEAVDRLAHPSNGAAWHELVSFLLALAGLPEAMVIATMRDDRVAVLDHHAALAENYAATGTLSPPLQLPTGEDLAEIVRRPFLFVPDLELEKQLIPTLLERVRKFAGEDNSRNAPISSYLPLISLTIARLYDEVAKPLIEEYRNFGRAPGRPADDPQTVTDDFDEAADRAAPDRLGPFLTVAAATSHQGRDYLDVGSAIAVLAEEAVQAAKEKSGPQWDEAEIGNVLRRLVGWAGSADQPFSLVSARWPPEGVGRILVTEMKARRLIVDEEGGRIRLVHEAVIRNWPAASTWLDFELPLLREMPGLIGMARKWQGDPVPDTVVDLSAPLFLKAALRLLAMWYEKLTEAHPADDPDQNLLLRDYCLDILRRHGTAGARVEDTPRQATHLMLAVFYGQIDIARRMVAEDREAVKLLRTDRRSVIFYPAFDNRLDLLDLLIENGADVDGADEKGWRAIHLAASRGACDAGRRLVEAGARLDGEGAPERTTPLHLAAGGGHADFVDFLVREWKVEVDPVDGNGMTPFLRAVGAESEETLSRLIALGARKDATTHGGTPADFGWSAIHLAAFYGLPKMVEALLREGLDPAATLRNGFTPLHLAAREGHTDVVRVLADALAAAGHGLDPRAFDEWTGTPEAIADKITARKDTKPDKDNGRFDVTPLHLAVRNGHVDVIRLLLARADVDAVTGSGATALHIAADSDAGAEAAAVLGAARPRTDVKDAHGRTALASAVRAKAWSVGRAIMALDPAADYAPDLWQAILAGNADAVRFFAHNAPDPKRLLTTPGPVGRTALHAAAIARSAAAVDVCLARGADPEARDDHGLTALHLAARSGDEGTLARLLRDAAPPRAEPGATTPLHLAAYAGGAMAVGQLLDAGWMTDAQDADGLTPFHRAAQAGELAAAEALATAGADIAAETGDGRANALTLAAAAGAEDVVALLVAPGRLGPGLAPSRGEPPVLTAIRHRRYGVAALLLDAGARPSTRDPATGLTLPRIYERQVREARARGEDDPRHAGLEAAFARANLTVALNDRKPPAAPESEPAAPAPAVPPEAAPLSPGHSEPGATGFVLDVPLSGRTDLWHDLGPDDLAEIAGRVAPVDGKWPLPLGETRATWRALPWYEGVEMIRLVTLEMAAQGVTLFFLRHRGDLYRLNGTSPPIHELNAKVPINLREADVLEYLRFFCYFVRGDEGPFYIAEDLRDPLLPQFTENAPLTALEGTVRPATYEGRSDGTFLCKAAVYYSNALFDAEFAVEPHGMVRMVNDEPIAADLPRKILSRLA